MLNFDNILFYPTQANAGGLLGLCMGFSVLSLLEIVYYGSIRLCCSYYRDKVLRNINTKTNLVDVATNNYFHSHGPTIEKNGCFFQVINEINHRIFSKLRREKSEIFFGNTKHDGRFRFTR